MVDTIKIDDIEYVRKDSQQFIPAQVDGLDYVIIRSTNAGVFAGYLEEDNDGDVMLRNARRIFYWDGAASLSQMAVSGVTKPQNCKFSVVVPKQKILGVIEILYASEAAKKNIEGVAIWIM